MLWCSIRWPNHWHVMHGMHCLSPRKGHLEAVCHIFAYPKRHNGPMLVFDPSRPNNIEKAVSAGLNGYFQGCQRTGFQGCSGTFRKICGDDFLH